MDEVQLNTLYVLSDGAYVRRDGETILIDRDRVEGGLPPLRVPAHMLDAVLCFGRVTVSPAAMALCAERGVAVSFLTPSGRLMARVDAPGSGSVVVRRAQVRAADHAARTMAIARAVVAGKIQSQRQNLLRSSRDSKCDADAEALRRAADLLRQSAEALPRATTLDAVRGHEGESTRLYFDHVARMTPDAPEPLRFSGRSRRPPTDAANALLSFLYGVLTNDCASALAAVGLDPSIGFLHADRPGRPSLALDLVEEFRAPLADRLAITLINRRQIAPTEFVTRTGGAVELSEAGRKTVVAAYQERKNERREHPLLGQQAPIGRFPFIQARILARHLRADLEHYVPVVFK
ncbi:MAG: type I-C CRISPR-associated endonuclease Cas1 [Phycisphaerales bacterium]|nr:type I-C CRISPR-associated endonuclease Cas1 [Phycisphaerales bacterium]